MPPEGALPGLSETRYQFACPALLHRWRTQSRWHRHSNVIGRYA